MTHSYVRQDSSSCVTWLIHMSQAQHSYDVRHADNRRHLCTMLYGTRLLQRCTNSSAHKILPTFNVYHDSSICDSFIRDTSTCSIIRLLQHCANSFVPTQTFPTFNMWHNSSICDSFIYDSSICAMTRLQRCANTRALRILRIFRVWHRTFIRTGWQKCTGCLIFVVHFSQKRPIISVTFAERDLQLKESYAFSPSCSIVRVIEEEFLIMNHCEGQYWNTFIRTVQPIAFGVSSNRNL